VSTETRLARDAKLVRTRCLKGNRAAPDTTQVADTTYGEAPWCEAAVATLQF